MKAIIFVICVLATALLVVSVTPASMLIPANENAKENAEAPENSNVITETNSGEWGLERVDFIHYANGVVKPAKGPTAQTCYKLLGVKWTALPVNYVINPTNPQGLSESFVTSAISTSAETWDAATSKELFNNAYKVNKSAQYGIQNYQNAIVFGNYSNDNVIAVTTFWYIPRGKRIVEFDVMFDTDWTWGDAAANSTVMDLQNIATHELGHGVGLDDIYSQSCSLVTMYGYSWNGDIDKRTLEQPDITGLQKIYGA